MYKEGYGGYYDQHYSSYIVDVDTQIDGKVTRAEPQSGNFQYRMSVTDKNIGQETQCKTKGDPKGNQRVPVSLPADTMSEENLKKECRQRQKQNGQGEC
jgi:hypothetical protein